MRITKVKVKYKMVLINRNPLQSTLIFEGKPEEDQSRYILPEQKKANFKLSIKNKTLRRKDGNILCPDCKQRKANLSDGEYFRMCRACKNNNFVLFKKKGSELIGQIIDGALNSKQVGFGRYDSVIQVITTDQIRLGLSQKFQQEFVYKAGSFNLVEIISKCINDRNINHMKPYKDWVKWYIDIKSSNMIKSIEKNIIDVSTSTSPRKEALKEWEGKYFENDKMDLSTFEKDLSTFEKKYKVDELIGLFDEFLKPTKDQKKITNLNGGLKQVLQTHQKTIFGKNNEIENEKENIELLKNRGDKQLTVYHLEIVKYLEHYFPLKKSNRKNKHSHLYPNGEINHHYIEHYLNGETIKKTVQHQIENALRSNLLHRGKVNHHKLDANTTSDTLSAIKRREAFILNLIDSCAFAANNIRNIVDRDQPGDIIGSKAFCDSLKNKKVDQKLLKSFYQCDESQIVDEHSLWAMRGSIQQIRNNVIHYKTDAIAEVFNIKTFECKTPEDSNPTYSSTIFQQLLNEALEGIPNAIAEQLKSGGVLSYYPIELIKQLLTSCKFSLCRSTLPFTPGFKNVASHGHNYQYSKGKNENKLALLHYIDKSEDKQHTEEEYQARYFLLKLIYNNMFLPYFTQDKTVFRETAKKIKRINSEYPTNGKTANKHAFNDIRDMNDSESIADYMAYVQSQLIQEKSKKSDRVNEDTRINFEKFLFQVFIKGFDNYLEAENLNFIKEPKSQFEVGITDGEKAGILNGFESNVIEQCTINNNINIEDDSHIAFFTLCKLLDASRLSNLRNELIKFRQTGNFDFHHILEIIELCLLSVDKVATRWSDLYDNADACLRQSKQFVEDGADIKEWGDMFLQQDKTTPIIHANIELCRKYGTAELLKEVVSKHKLTKNEFDEWNGAKSGIAEKTEQRGKLHEQWVKNKQQFSEKNKYKKLCEYIDRYNWLDNKLHFVHLNRLHGIMIDILGRMAGFVALWDRDFILLDAHRTDDEFQLKAVMRIDGGTAESFKNVQGVNKTIVGRNGNKIEKSDKNRLTACLEAKRDMYGKFFFKDDALVSSQRKYEHIEKAFFKRNHIAHFGYISTVASGKSLIDMINDLRDLFEYDRKLKNAVSKSFIDMFDKYGMELTLKFNIKEHKLELDSITPKKVYHLGSKGQKDENKNNIEITTDQVHKEFCEICKELLTFK